jgi:hypothetical protein
MENTPEHQGATEGGSQHAIVSPSWLIERLVEQVELTWSRLLVGGACESVYATTAAMRKPPKIGDLVLIGSVGANVPATERIGWLLSIEHLPCREIEDEDDYVPSERRWTIDRLDGSGHFSWVNVSVTRVIREDRLDQLTPIIRANAGHLAAADRQPE